jgi:hypothetical protein
MQIEVKKPLDAPIGKPEMVNTPWGTVEQAQVFKVIDYISGDIKYAVINNPAGNFKVRCSAFRVR